MSENSKPKEKPAVLKLASKPVRALSLKSRGLPIDTDEALKIDYVDLSGNLHTVKASQHMAAVVLGGIGTFSAVAGAGGGLYRLTNKELDLFLHKGQLVALDVLPSDEVRAVRTTTQEKVVFMELERLPSCRSVMVSAVPSKVPNARVRRVLRWLDGIDELVAGMKLENEAAVIRRVEGNFITIDIRPKD